LEPTFFLFWEEADFCMRAKKAGVIIEICYEAELLHKVSASFVGGTPHKTYFWWRGRFLWIERNCSKEEKDRLYQTILFPEMRHLLKLRLIKSFQLLLLTLIQRKNLSQKKNKLLQYKAALEGYRDFRNASFGSGPAWLFGNQEFES
jgi:GT2 family glycosyltransferase